MNDVSVLCAGGREKEGQCERGTGRVLCAGGREKEGQCERCTCAVYRGREKEGQCERCTCAVCRGREKEGQCERCTCAVCRGRAETSRTLSTGLAHSQQQRGERQTLVPLYVQTLNHHVAIALATAVCVILREVPPPPHHVLPSIPPPHPELYIPPKGSGTI